jgi:hypothetical protein
MLKATAIFDGGGAVATIELQITAKQPATEPPTHDSD